MQIKKLIKNETKKIADAEINFDHVTPAEVFTDAHYTIHNGGFDPNDKQYYGGVELLDPYELPRNIKKYVKFEYLYRVYINFTDNI